MDESPFFLDLNEVPYWTVQAAWMVGVSRAEDRAWYYVGAFSGITKTPVSCPCGNVHAGAHLPATRISLAPLATVNGNRAQEILMVGQCRYCETVLWGKVA
jgi:hypothetical protein